MKTKEQLYQSQAERRKERDWKAKRIATSGEKMAEDFLLANSYTILARNFRGGRQGEIDIVAAAPDGVLTFVEVKTRTVDGVVYGIPEIGFEAVSYSKQRKIQLTSAAYMKKQGLISARWRYDVIVIYVSRDASEPPRIFHVEDAFR